jgi:hypothetical protein
MITYAVRVISCDEVGLSWPSWVNDYLITVFVLKTKPVSI